MAIWCGIDWAEHHHDVALVDDVGKLIAKLHIDDDAAGFARLLTLLAEHGAGPETPVPIAMETAHGLLAAALVAAGYRLFPINPMAVARYRDRYSVSRAKSDAGDAFVLANILRTDLDAHRPLPGDSELAQAVRVLARAQQDTVWERQQTGNKLRSLLREYYPAALIAFPDLAQPGRNRGPAAGADTDRRREADPGPHPRRVAQGRASTQSRRHRRQGPQRIKRRTPSATASSGSRDG